MKKHLKNAAIVFVVSGSILFLVSLLADYIGVGDVDPDHFTFGHKQKIVAVVGFIGMLIGFILWRKN